MPELRGCLHGEAWEREAAVKYLYGVKGCAHCDNNRGCSKELKKSQGNLIPMVKDEPGKGMKPRVVRGRGQRVWQTFCQDFTRPAEAKA